MRATEKAFECAEPVLKTGSDPAGWARELRGRLGPASRVLEGELLARRTTLRVGGPADVLVEPATDEDLALAVRYARERRVPLFLLGRGSNLVVRDGGIRGLVVALTTPAYLRLEVDGTRIWAGAGVRMKELANAARKAGVAGFEFVEGIPGSVGGGLRMNAGAMGAQMFDRVEVLRVMTPAGEIRELERGEIAVEYRSCALLRDHVALGAWMRGTPDAPDAVKNRMDAYSRKRWESQPNQPSAGCIFKNPSDEIRAGRTIDELGLKGMKVGRAMVSDVHANFIVNLGGATAAEVLELAEQVRARVRAARGIELKTEVEIVGEGCGE